MASRTRLILCASAVALTSQMVVPAPAGAENSFSKVNLAPDKKGGIQDMQDISKYCGTKPLKVAYSDGWGGNYWRQITRAEFENEAAKCPNITEVRYFAPEYFESAWYTTIKNAASSASPSA